VRIFRALAIPFKMALSVTKAALEGDLILEGDQLLDQILMITLGRTPYKAQIVPGMELGVVCVEIKLTATLIRMVTGGENLSHLRWVRKPQVRKVLSVIWQRTTRISQVRLTVEPAKADAQAPKVLRDSELRVHELGLTNRKTPRT